MPFQGLHAHTAHLHSAHAVTWPPGALPLSLPDLDILSKDSVVPLLPSELTLPLTTRFLVLLCLDNICVFLKKMSLIYF